MAIRAVTFDCYGTLIDWETGFAAAAALDRTARRSAAADLFAAWERAQRKLYEPYRPYREIVELAAYTALARFGVVARAEELSAVSASMASWPPFDDARRALAALKGKVKLGVLSNADAAVLARSLESLGTSVDFSVSAEEIRSYKPAPAHFEEGLKRAAVPAAEILHVAFGFDYDIAPAKAAGMRTCWVNRAKRPRPAGAAPDHEMASLDELPPLVASLGG